MAIGWLIFPTSYTGRGENRELLIPVKQACKLQDVQADKYYDVLLCSMMFYDVLWCSRMFYDVLWCSIMFYEVLRCFMIFYDVIWSYVLRAFLVSFCRSVSPESLRSFSFLYAMGAEIMSDIVQNCCFGIKQNLQTK